MTGRQRLLEQDPVIRSVEQTEWAPPNLHPPAPSWSLLGLVPVGVAGGVAWAMAGPVPALAASGIVTAATAIWAGAQGRLALRSVSAARIDGGQFPRLRNLVDGLSAGAHTEPPELWVIPEGGPNALVCRTGRPVIAISENLLLGYSRLELEAVVAHCVGRMPGLRNLSVAVALGPLGRRVSGRVGGREDATAVQLTRYPPALATAIEKARPTTTRFGFFWFVGGLDTHEPQSARVEGLMDL